MPRVDQVHRVESADQPPQTSPALSPETQPAGLIDLFGDEVKPFGPFWQTTDEATVRLYHGHVIDVLSKLPEESVHCIVTSPPYWGLRDYKADKRYELGSEKRPDCLGWACGVNCAEQDWPNSCYVCRMVLVCRSLGRVLRDDGTIWLNLGDTYGGGGNTMGPAIVRGSQKKQALRDQYETMNGSQTGLASGNLVGIPWRVALALQADGWVLRQDVIWHKPSPMPESVKNRCTKSHEFVLLLTKKMGYFYDAEAIKEGFADERMGNPGRYNGSLASDEAIASAVLPGRGVRGEGWNEDGSVSGRNKRSVWTVSSQGYPGAHFATFPPRLIEPMIKAGTSERGCCADCGVPWRRIVEERKLTRERPNEYVKRTGEEGTGNSCANTVAGVDVRTVGWEPTCECHGKIFWEKVIAGKSTARVPGGDRNQDGDCGASPREEGEREVRVARYVSDLPLDEHPVVPCVVLDPFVGSGTTPAVCIGLGRHSVGIDLSEQYLRVNAIPRVEGELMDRPALRSLLP